MSTPFLKHLNAISTTTARVAAALAVIVLGISTAPPAWAQVRATSSDQVILPQGLQWQRMESVDIFTKEKPHVRSANPAFVTAVEHIWSDEVDSLLKRSNTFVQTALVARTEVRGQPVHFTIIGLMDFERCQPPLDGKDVVDSYSRCLARVAIGPLQRAHVVEFRDFCQLNIDFDPNTPLERNHTQFAFDRSTSTAYFRVIQRGQFVPACNRSIRLEGL